MIFVFKLVCLLLITIAYIQSQDWNYYDLGPDVWSEIYPTCGGKSQSPINIITTCTVYKDFQPPLILSSNYNSTLNFTLLNNGYAITGTINKNQNATSLQVTGGGLNGIFQFLSFHLHWGDNYKCGSEHQVNGMKYAGEIHLIFINPNNNQTAVFGTFVKSQVITNDTSVPAYDGISRQEWQTYFNTAETLQTQNSSALVNLSFAQLLGYKINDFWRYEGSLTTPPCTEGIIWTVFRQPIVIDESQLRPFRQNLSLKFFREPQPLNNRIVYRNFIDETIPPISNHDCCFSTSTVPTLMHFFSYLSFLGSFIFIFLEKLSYTK